MTPSWDAPHPSGETPPSVETPPAPRSLTRGRSALLADPPPLSFLGRGRNVETPSAPESQLSCARKAFPTARSVHGSPFGVGQSQSQRCLLRRGRWSRSSRRRRSLLGLGSPLVGLLGTKSPALVHIRAKKAVCLPSAPNNQEGHCPGGLKGRAMAGPVAEGAGKSCPTTICAVTLRTVWVVYKARCHASALRPLARGYGWRSVSASLAPSGELPDWF